MFVFSKLVWIFGQPLSLAFLFGLLAFLAALLRWRATTIISSLLSLLILFVSLYTTAGAYVVQGLEDRFPRVAADPADDGNVVYLHDVSAAQLDALPLYEKNHLSRHVEIAIRKIFEDNGHEHGNDNFYHHAHFDDDRFYHRKH